MDLINGIYKPYLDKFMVVFIDDILIYSWNKESHIKHLRMTLQKLREHQLYGKLSKCEFWLGRVMFLGHIIIGDEISVDLEKVKAILEWKVPRTITKIQSFFGDGRILSKVRTRFL